MFRVNLTSGVVLFGQILFCGNKQSTQIPFGEKRQSSVCVSGTLYRYSTVYTGTVQYCTGAVVTGVQYHDFLVLDLITAVPVDGQNS